MPRIGKGIDDVSGEDHDVDDDTEGHMPRIGRGIDDGSGEDDDDDTEGHMPGVNKPEIVPVTADAHATTAVDDDAEGHGLPSSAYEREGGTRWVKPRDADDDVEGHINFRPLDNHGGS